MSRKFASPHGDDRDFDLPPGWYRKTDNYGRSFYVDTQSRKSYWRKPVAVKGGLVIKTEEERREEAKLKSKITKNMKQIFTARKSKHRSGWSMRFGRNSRE